MAKKWDGIIEAVRYEPGGKVALVRLYERRGPTYSDRVIRTRPELIEQLEKGKKIALGRRLEFMAGTFQADQALQLGKLNGAVVLHTGHIASEQDDLRTTPHF
jgi:tartrate dehydratase beta subunit/fumarate hydratase class I family protein